MCNGDMDVLVCGNFSGVLSMQTNYAYPAVYSGKGFAEFISIFGYLCHVNAGVQVSKQRSFIVRSSWSFLPACSCRLAYIIHVDGDVHSG